MMRIWYWFRRHILRRKLVPDGWNEDIIRACRFKLVMPENRREENG